MARKFIFLDTNIYMHYKPVHEIGWCDIVGVENVEIVVPRITLRELDKQKDNNSNRRVTDRIRNFLKSLEVWIDAPRGQVKDRVYVSFYNGTPKFDLQAKNLDARSNDDYLIATVLQWQQEHKGEELILFAHDTGIRLTARGLGLSARDLPEEFLAPIAIDPLVAENERLKKEVQRLTNAAPKLTLRFADAAGEGAFLRVEAYPPIILEDDAIENILAKERNKLPFLPKFVSSGLMSMPDFANQGYNTALNNYLTDYEEFLRNFTAHKQFLNEAIALNLLLTNSGTAPAQDVDVFLTFADNITVFDADKTSEPPERPVPPSLPGPGMSYLNTYIRMPDILSLSEHFEQAEENLAIEKNNVKVHLTRVKHGTPVSLPRLFAKFDSFDEAKSFSIEYRLEVGNLATSPTGRLNVKLDLPNSIT